MAHDCLLERNNCFDCSVRQYCKHINICGAETGVLFHGQNQLLNRNHHTTCSVDTHSSHVESSVDIDFVIVSEHANKAYCCVHGHLLDMLRFHDHVLSLDCIKVHPDSDLSVINFSCHECRVESPVEGQRRSDACCHCTGVVEVDHHKEMLYGFAIRKGDESHAQFTFQPEPECNCNTQQLEGHFGTR